MSTSGTPSGATGFFTDWTTEVATEPTHRDVDKPPSRFSAVLERSAGIRRGALALGTVAASAVAVAFIAPNPAANADPSASTWQRLRMCESSNNYKINTGNGYYGAYQFDLSTWRSVGGSGYPNLASPAEQDARALMLYRLRGWQPWTCASILGLREDSDARSGRINDISIGSAGSGGGSTAGSAAGSGSTSVPAFPGTRWYHFGDDNATIKRFQDQMHHRGFFPPGTGQYGPLTLAMVEQLQRLNGLIPNGYLGPNTWRMAWVGKYSAPSGGSTSAPAPAPAPSPVTASHGASAPAFPGSRWYHFGDNNATIKRFQDQMHRRGFFPPGTGQYGPLTLAMVEQLQRLNGLIPNGELGPNTWRMAWVGKYHR